MKKQQKQQDTSSNPTRSVLSQTFRKPPIVPPFAIGGKIRQANRNQFFSRTRRGSI